MLRQCLPGASAVLKYQPAPLELRGRLTSATLFRSVLSLPLQLVKPFLRVVFEKRLSYRVEELEAKAQDFSQQPAIRIVETNISL
jgi:hypothetical protein